MWYIGGGCSTEAVAGYILLCVYIYTTVCIYIHRQWLLYRGSGRIRYIDSACSTEAVAGYI